MRAAIIENGVISNVIEVADEQAAAEFGAVALPDGSNAQIGWSQVGDDYAPPIEPPPTKEALIAYSAACRWKHEVGGIVFNGWPIPTDERTQQVLTAAYIKASADPNYTIDPWKAGPGVYVALTAAEIVAIADAVSEHVQAAFSLNRTCDEMIEAGTITTLAQVAAFYA
jgi:hypothetical protein